MEKKGKALAVKNKGLQKEYWQRMADVIDEKAYRTWNVLDFNLGCLCRNGEIQYSVDTEMAGFSKNSSNDQAK